MKRSLPLKECFKEFCGEGHLKDCNAFWMSQYLWPCVSCKGLVHQLRVGGSEGWGGVEVKGVGVEGRVVGGGWDSAWV